MGWDHRAGRDTTPEQTTITIKKCPQCGESHTYDLTVQRSHMRFADTPLPRRYVRIFACPKGGTFQSEITLSGYIEDAGDPQPQSG